LFCAIFAQVTLRENFDNYLPYHQFAILIFLKSASAFSCTPTIGERNDRYLSSNDEGDLMTVRYLATDTALLYKDSSGKDEVTELLWGDQLTIVEAGAEGIRHKVSARGHIGYVEHDAVGDESLLELYFIDVGQGDGVLVRTPDNRHIMIDGGYKRASQPTGKNAADFVDWKFAKDYGLKVIALDAMIATHNDADHYGGLSDLLDVRQIKELDADKVTVDNFFHAGVGWWKKAETGRWLGQTTADGKYLTQLMGDRNAVLGALLKGAPQELQGEWATLLGKVVETKTRTNLPTPISRISHSDDYLPGFGPADGAPAIRILAPVEFTVDGQAGLHNYGASASHNTNGNSVLLRLDYGHARILLTGDLNRFSQRALLEDYEGNNDVFACDVAKACHHGSDDVSYRFLSAMAPAVTVISSGDAEGHDHPRPSIVAASAITGHLEMADDRLVTPLVYSTELARSLNLGKVSEASWTDGQGSRTLQGNELAGLQVKCKVTKAGALNPTTVTRNLEHTYIVAGLIYGLVNVRTDGNRILCATLNESTNSWEVKVVKPRF
jgi:beta-lactamase superfamily II metal-dependent hydrolase